jgi:hypothetical protein
VFLNTQKLSITQRGTPDRYKHAMMCQTQQNLIMSIIVLGQHVSILIESSSGPSKKTDPY